MVDGGLELAQPFLGRHDPLARHVPALLGPLLVLEEDAGRARFLEQLDRADDVERVAVAGVAVDHDRGAAHGAAHASGRVGDLGLRQVPEVGQTQLGRGGAVTRHEHHVEARLHREASGQCVVDARHEHRSAVGEQGTQPVTVHGATA